MGPARSGALDRHQQRRAAGLPTLSVLVGRAGLAVREARRWAEEGGRTVARVSDPRAGPVLDAWVDALAARRDLAADALAWLARSTRRPPESLSPRAGRMTPHDVSVWFDAAPPAETGTDTGSACRWLLERWADREAVAGPGLAARLGAALTGHGGAGESAGGRVVAALGGLVPAASDPVLLLDRAETSGDAAGWVAEAAQSLARLATAWPPLTALLAVAPGDLDAYLRAAPESRAKSLARAGVVAVPDLDEAEVARRVDAAAPGTAEGLRAAVRRVAADGASERLVDLFLAAARDPARSAAERFLFERLDSLPKTSGLFEQNAALDFRFGPKAMEVDLLARALRLAVEVDGYYHFLDADAYRRDRRKDFELQARGYLVVRVLAEDVVARLEEVLDVIQEAVALRSARPAPNPSEAP